MPAPRLRRIFVLTIIPATLLAAVVWIALPLLYPRPKVRHQIPVARAPLDPLNDRLTDLYMNPHLVPIENYEETIYPKAFEKDGLGPLDTKAFCVNYHEMLSDWLRNWLAQRTAALERNPKDKKVLEEIAVELEIATTAAGWCRSRIASARWAASCPSPRASRTSRGSFAWAASRKRSVSSAPGAKVGRQDDRTHGRDDVQGPLYESLGGGSQRRGHARGDERRAVHVPLGAGSILRPRGVFRAPPPRVREE